MPCSGSCFQRSSSALPSAAGHHIGFKTGQGKCKGAPRCRRLLPRRLRLLFRLRWLGWGGRPLLIGGLGAAGAPEYVAPDEIADVDGILRRDDLTTVRDELFVSPRFERNIVGAE